MGQKKWGTLMLTAIVVGNMVGAGIFMLPATLAKTASPGANITTWLITGLGVLMLALVFGNLAIRKPNLTSGPQSHAHALFTDSKKGELAGFSMVWGYWVANWSSNVAIITSFAGYLTTFFPIMTSQAGLFTVGNTTFQVGQVITFLVCSALLWGTHFILVHGMSGAGKLKFLATAAKVIGFALFIIITLFAFQSSNLGELYTPIVTDKGETLGFLGQINGAALTTLWAFIGIESASILATRAKSQQAVKSATILGLMIALIIYLGITVLTMGVLPAEVLMNSDRPLVDALSAVVGSNGATVMAILALTCLFGSLVGWILLSSEVPYQAAKEGYFPAIFAKENKNGSPILSLTVTNIMSQLFIFSTLSRTISDAYNFIILVATLAYLIPYLVSPILQLKLAITGETYNGVEPVRVTDGIIACLALLYAFFAILSGTGDLQTFGLGIGLFFIGFILYPISKRYEKSTTPKKSKLA